MLDRSIYISSAISPQMLSPLDEQLVCFQVSTTLALGRRNASLKRNGGCLMPYLRLYSSDVSIEQKRAIAQRLIEITIRAFNLRLEERHSVTVQFIQSPQRSGVDSFQPLIPRGADFVLEVIAHHLTDAKKQAFGEAAATMLPPLLPTKARSRLARLLGIKSDPDRQVALQFAELSPAISDPFVADSERRAA
jgi:hypothetical protein